MSRRLAPATPRERAPRACPGLWAVPGRTVQFGGGWSGRRPVKILEHWCGSPVFRGRRAQSSPARVAAGLVHPCWSEHESRSGGGRNRTRRGTFVPPPILKARPAFPPPVCPCPELFSSDAVLEPTKTC